MISPQPTTFKYVDRGERSSIVLIPGWASDYRIFQSLDLKFNYLLPLNFSPFTFEKGLLSVLKKYSLDKISLFGWSLGGFLACEFSARYSSYVDELILVSIRNKYTREELEEINRSLEKSRKGCLYKFYSRCFHKNEHRDYFKRNFRKKYCEEMELGSLMSGLDYLSKTEIRTESLEKLEKITIVHGEFDKIAPLQEANNIKDNLPKAKFIVVQDTGHMPFLKEDFSHYIR